MTLASDTSAVVFESDDTTSTRSPVIPDEFNIGAAGLKRIYNELKSLCAEPDEKPPTEYALNRAIEILEGAAYAMMRLEPKTTDGSADFPVGFVASDGEGGIRIEWWHMKKYCVHLVVGHSKEVQEYVFFKLSESADGSINRRVFPNRLASQLMRLNKLRSEST